MKEITVTTPLGTLCACTGGDLMYPEIFVYLRREDGTELDLTAVEVPEDGTGATAYLWADTSTDSYTKHHKWSKKELLIEE